MRPKWLRMHQGLTLASKSRRRRTSSKAAQRTTIRHSVRHNPSITKGSSLKLMHHPKRRTKKVMRAKVGPRK